MSAAARDDLLAEIESLRATVTQLERQLAERDHQASLFKGEREQHLLEQIVELEQAYHAYPIGLGLVDRDLRFIRINQRLAEINGVTTEGHLGRTVREIIPQIAPTVEPLYRHVFETGEPVADVEVDGMTFAQPGMERHWNVDYFPVFAADGTVRCVSVMVQDTTERKAAADGLKSSKADLENRVAQRTTELTHSEQLLREQSRMLRSIIDSITDGVAVVDREGRFLVFNTAGEKILGLGAIAEPPTEWPASYGLFLPDGSALCPAEQLPLVRAMKGETVRDAEILVRLPNQRDTIFLSVNAAPLIDDRGEVGGGVAVFRDITARKQFEQQLASEERLLRKLLELQEQERQLVASEIHDGFVQLVVGGHMRLQAVADALPTADESVRDNLCTITILLQRAIIEARRMISELRPLILDEDGLVSAIRHLAADEHFCEGLQVDFSHDVQHAHFDSILEGCLFRIVQEALNNVKRHSGAAQATVRLVEEENRLRVEIDDCGSGFDPENVSSERFGLRSIRERARLFGGSAEISSKPGGGCRVKVIVPVSMV